ncbi:MAG: saccharopine dehydrogenase NADP-binding domain-containing protein [Xanthomonadales bacterium]|jgi:short subunit dehydrogenase-like uncharacterized protein|nr:saccharopine dehydrogenase NADP-binding domain-containing protein [Xanthomonadales bacterium]
MEWMIYGANGYTGRLIATEAKRRGLRPVLAGRNAEAIHGIGESLGLETRVFDLEAGVGTAIEGMRLVLHCAGPFSRTSAPMLEACLGAGVHYLDITGEIDVFEHAWRQDERARRADVLVCPGVGFDVVPTDCLAAMLVREVPSTTSLVLAFEAAGGPSRGTALTSLESLGSGGRVRKDGELTHVPMAWKTRRIPFAHAERTAVTIPWGDVFTAWVSTGVPDVEVYLSMPPAALKQMQRMARFSGLLRWGWVQSWLRRRVESRPAGPDEDLRAKTGVEVWGEATGADGRRIQGTLSGPNGYDVTVSASLGITEHVLHADVTGGYTTPSLLMGPDFAAGLPGVEVSLGDVLSG